MAMHLHTRPVWKREKTGRKLTLWSQLGSHRLLTSALKTNDHSKFSTNQTIHRNATFFCKELLCVSKDSKNALIKVLRVINKAQQFKSKTEHVCGGNYYNCKIIILQIKKASKHEFKVSQKCQTEQSKPDL